jgi:DNA-directed RNA polymerase specialized sigma24 family protein
LRSERLFHGGEIRNWLFTILINLNRNRLRTLSRRPQHAPLEDADVSDLAGPEPVGAISHAHWHRSETTSARHCCSSCSKA